LQKPFAFFPATDGSAVAVEVPALRTPQRHARFEPEIPGSDLPENPFKVNGRPCWRPRCFEFPAERHGTIASLGRLDFMR